MTQNPNAALDAFLKPPAAGESMSGADIILRVLSEQGVDTLFGYSGGAILPTVFKQDPRYFYKGTGSKKSRALYALANAVICKGDNGKWQPAYSSILGSIAAGGISNLYYAKVDRNGAELTFENALVGIGANAMTNLLQEFVVKKLTPHAQNPPVAAAP